MPNPRSVSLSREFKILHLHFGLGQLLGYRGWMCLRNHLRTGKSTGWPSRVLGFNFQNPNSGSQSSITPGPGYPISSSDLCVYCTHMVRRYTCKQKFIHIKRKIERRSHLIQHSYFQRTHQRPCEVKAYLGTSVHIWNFIPIPKS